MELIALLPMPNVDVVGINNITCSDLQVKTGAAVIMTRNYGPIIVYFHQHAWNRKGSNIHSPLQFEAFGQEVIDKATTLW